MTTANSRSWLEQCSIFAAIAMSGVTLACGGNALAQIVPDDTLGQESSVVTRLNAQRDDIEGGALRGANLFHSFSEFNIGEGREAYFANPAGVKTIFSRVTGSNPSNLLGTLGVLGEANLFFLNPNGILFGPNASLDLKGSFVASTASRLTFPDGTQYSAMNPEAPPLLTVDVPVPIGLQFEGEQPGAVLVQGSRLEVQPGRTLALTGGNVSLEGGAVLAPEGRVELGGLVGAGTVKLNEDGHLSFPDGVARATVSLINGAEVNVRAGGGGSIAINTQNFHLAGGSTLRAGIAAGLGSVDSKAGNTQIDATGEITLTDTGSFISNAVLPNARGRGGDVNITTGSLEVTSGAQIFAGTFGQGDAGSVTINVRDTASFDGVGSNGISSGAYSLLQEGAVGQGGNVNLTTGALRVTNGASLQASTFGQGDAGNVTINVRDTAFFDGVGSNEIFSGAYSRVEPKAEGNAGSVNITAGTLSATNGAVLTTSTDGRGKAGDVTINAGNVVFDGEGDFNPQLGFRQSSGAFSSVKRNGVGQGGNVNVTADLLSVTNGAAIDTSTRGQGDAGSVTVNVRDLASFDGVGPAFEENPDFFSSGAYSRVESGAVGQGGDVSVTAETVSVTNGAVLTTSTDGRGKAGDVTINAGNVVFDGEGDFNPQLGFRQSSGAFSSVKRNGVGRGGNVNVTADLLSVTNGAAIDTSTRGQGDAGSIWVNDADLVTLSGVGADGFSSGFYSTTELGAKGQGGEITVSTADFRVQNGAKVSASTSSDRQGGSITVTAPEAITIRGNGRLSVETSGAGSAGDLTIETEKLSILDEAQVSASTSSRHLSGVGGNVKVDASQSVELSNGARLLAESTGAAPAGNLTITTDQITVQNGSAISVTSPASRAGNLTITADTLSLNDSQISAETGVTGAEAGANIFLQNLDLLLLENESFISATALEDANGGNVSIDSRFVIVMPPEGANGSDIIAKAFEGDGGRIDIDAISIFGIEERRAIDGNQTNDFDASSEFGAPGEVNLNTQFDPSRGLTTLPDEPRDPEVTEECQASGGQDTVQFYDIGRGGSPPRPDEPLNADTLVTEWIPLDSETENSPRSDENIQGRAIALHGETIHADKVSASIPRLLPPCQSR